MTRSKRIPVFRKPGRVKFRGNLQSRVFGFANLSAQAGAELGVHEESFACLVNAVAYITSTFGGCLVGSRKSLNLMYLDHVSQELLGGDNSLGSIHCMLLIRQLSSRGVERGMKPHGQDEVSNLFAVAPGAQRNQTNGKEA